MSSSQRHARSFIPNRDGLDISTSYSLLSATSSPATTSTSSSANKGKRKANTEFDAQAGECSQGAAAPSNSTDLVPLTEEANRTFDSLLRSELFGPTSVETDPRLRSPSRSHSRYTGSTSPQNSPTAKPILNFSSPTRKRVKDTMVDRGLDSPTHERYSLSPVRHESQKLLLSPKKTIRQVSRVPFKVSQTPFFSREASSLAEPLSAMLPGTRCT